MAALPDPSTARVGREATLRCHSCGRLVLWKAMCTSCVNARRALAAATASEHNVRSRLYPEAESVRSARPAPGVCAPRALRQPGSSESDLRRGLILGDRYRLYERVGSGGTATVYRGRDLVQGAEVAVKILHEALADDEGILERFRREACTAERLRHPNLVPAFAHGRSEGLHYIVMEHVHGPSVKALVADRRPLEAAHAIDITLQILAGTGFIHGHGIIHRDLKPGNVLLSAGALAKVTDFGIASSPGGDLTPAGSFLGTVHYLAPERVTGAPATEASDVYSIGIMLYELLTGSPPFAGELVATVALQHLNERPVPPACVNEAVTPGLNAVVLGALEKSPRDRITDCAAFAAALRCEASVTTRFPRMRSVRLAGADAA